MPVRNQCNYVMKTGMECGRTCYGTWCWKHAACREMASCKNCGKMTHSVTGYCSSSGCRTMQQTINARAAEELRRAANEPRWDTEVEAYLQELVS